MSHLEQEGEPVKDALSVPIKAFSYDVTEITPQLMLKASRDPVLTNFIWSATWYFHEKFWLLGYPQGQKTTKVLSQWFLENTCLPNQTAPSSLSSSSHKKNGREPSVPLGC